MSDGLKSIRRFGCVVPSISPVVSPSTGLKFVVE